MFPYRRMPWHITVIYVYAVINLLTLFSFTFVEADVIVLNSNNSTTDIFADFPAEFSPHISRDGVQGIVVMASPEEACSRLNPPPHTNTTYDWFVLVKRYGCSFEEKALTALNKGYKAVIIYNVGSNSIEPFGQRSKNLSPMLRAKLNIITVLVGESDGQLIRDRYTYQNGYTIIITPELPFNLNNYLLPFAVVVGVCFLIMLIFTIVKCIRDRRRSRRNRLPSRQLKKIPVKKYKKGDDYDVCAICLDDYSEGEKLRILPCSHAYHSKCIDPWLTNNKRTCPVCKRKVFVGERRSSDNSDSDSDVETSSTSEHTPLLFGRSSGERSTYGHTNRSLLSQTSGQNDAGSSASRREENEHQQSPSDEPVATTLTADTVVVVPVNQSINNDSRDDVGDEVVASTSTSHGTSPIESRRKKKKRRPEGLLV